MFIPIFWALAFGIMLTLMMAPKRSRAVCVSVQPARFAAAEEGSGGVEARREMRYRADRSATASIMGAPENQYDCRVLNLSRSGLRIVSNHAFPKGSQVCVQWGDEFFVGTVLYAASNNNEHVSGLELTSGNHTWHPLARLRFWRRSEQSLADL